MLDNNPTFSKENIKKLASYADRIAYTLQYDANDTEEQHDAAEKILLIKYLLAHIGDHFFGYFPASYFLNNEQKQPYKDFIDDLKQDPITIIEILVGFVDSAFNEVEYIEYSSDEQYRRPKREKDVENAINDFLEEVYHNKEEFTQRLYAAPQNQDESKPSEERLSGLINAIGHIQEYMLKQGDAHNQVVQAFQFSKMLEMFKLPLLFAWEQYKYGWHTDFMKEGDSLLEYDMFIFNATEHIKNCISILESESPFRHFERNGQITADLKTILSEVSRRLKSGEMKIS